VTEVEGLIISQTDSERPFRLTQIGPEPDAVGKKKERKKFGQRKKMRSLLSQKQQKNRLKRNYVDTQAAPEKNRDGLLAAWDSVFPKPWRPYYPRMGLSNS